MEKEIKLEDLFKEWCKETKRTGSVLMGSSVREFFEWLEQKKIKLYV
jgi:hypothetical protein